jgi:transcriptional regulator with XRE-family HTH domain
MEAMERDETRKAFGARLKQLRKQKSWMQKELAEKIDVRFAQLDKYESGLHTPPLDKLVLLAEVLGTTVDYLLTGDGTEAPPLHSQRLLARLQELQQLDDKDQNTVLELLDAFLFKQKIAASLERSTR